jgi:hypothetical protein
LPTEDQPLTEDERWSRAADWSDYRKAYGQDPDPANNRHNFELFCAGWDAGRRSTHSPLSREAAKQVRDALTEWLHETYPGHHQATWDGDKHTTCTCALDYDHPIEQTTIAHHSAEPEPS